MSLFLFYLFSGTICTTTSGPFTSTSSDNERLTGKKMVSPVKDKGRIKQKKIVKVKTKERKIKASNESDGEPKNQIQDIVTTSEKHSDPLDNSLNKTLRWENICSDSEDESERITLYKENRRKRYIEALQVNVVKNYQL